MRVMLLVQSQHSRAKFIMSHAGQAAVLCDKQTVSTRFSRPYLIARPHCPRPLYTQPTPHHVDVAFT